MNEGNRSTESVPELPIELTPAAREALNLHVDAYRRDLLEKAWRLHLAQESDGALRASEVVEAVTRTSMPRRDVRRYGYLVFLALTLLLILPLALAALVYLVEIPDWGKLPMTSAAALVSGVAAMITVLVAISQSYYFLRRSKRAQEEADSVRLVSAEFVRRLAEVETTARRVTADRLGSERPSRLTLRSVLSFLLDAGIWSRGDLQSFRNLLTHRNSLVHEDKFSLSPQQAKEGIAEMDRLLKLIIDKNPLSDSRDVIFR